MTDKKMTADQLDEMYAYIVDLGLMLRKFAKSVDEDEVELLNAVEKTLKQLDTLEYQDERRPGYITQWRIANDVAPDWC